LYAGKRRTGIAMIAAASAFFALLFPLIVHAPRFIVPLVAAFGLLRLVTIVAAYRAARGAARGDHAGS
jgi:hypothetical protein